VSGLTPFLRSRLKNFLPPWLEDNCVTLWRADQIFRTLTASDRIDIDFARFQNLKGGDEADKEEIQESIRQ
jgi:hypothetical protein